MKRHPTGMLFIMMFFFASAGISTAWADIIVMNNGMLINGKLIKETVPRYLFTNSYGTFNIKKELVKEIYITGSYTEDIAIMKKLGAKIDEDIIKKNIEEGMKRKKIEEAKAEKKRLERERIEEAKKKRKEAYAEKKKKRLEELEAAEAEAEKKEPEKTAKAKTIKKGVKGKIEEKAAKKQEQTPEKHDYWYFGRLGLEGAYYSTFLTRSLYGRVPHGLSLHLTYDQGLDSWIKKRNPGMPGIRFEIGYIDYERNFLLKSSQRISGYIAHAGPMWAFPSLTSSWGCIVLAALPGAGYFDIVNKDTSSRSTNFHFSAIGLIGYEYSFNVISLFIHIRYMYIYDQNVAFHAVGGSMGFSCRLW
jgi:hypothetical protein